MWTKMKCVYSIISKISGGSSGWDTFFLLLRCLVCWRREVLSSHLKEKKERWKEERADDLFIIELMLRSHSNGKALSFPILTFGFRLTRSLLDSFLFRLTTFAVEWVFFKQTTNICLLISSWQWRRELQSMNRVALLLTKASPVLHSFRFNRAVRRLFLYQGEWMTTCTLSFLSFMVHIGALSGAFTWCVLLVVLKAKVNNLVHCDSPAKAKWNSFLSWNKRTHMLRIARCCLFSLSSRESVELISQRNHDHSTFIQRIMFRAKKRERVNRWRAQDERRRGT